MTSIEKPYKITSTAVAVGGSVDSGKSTLIGVLMSSVLDDGNGLARARVAKHPHEIASGRTSDISTRIYDIPGNSEATTLVDLCGHETYFKTTTFGVSGYFPDYAFLIVSASRGILPMTKQHLRLMLSLSVPIIIIVTHADIVPEEVYKNTLDGITKSCVMFGGKLVSTTMVNDISHQTIYTGDITSTKSIVSNEELVFKTKAIDTIVNAVTNISDGKQTMFPVVTVSNKSGFFIDIVRKVLSNLKMRHFWLPGGEKEVMNNKVVKMFRLSLERQKEGLSSIMPSYKEFTGGIFYVDCAYNPPGIGLVVTGINRGTTIIPGQQNFMYMGPFGKEFKKIRIKSLHNNMRQIVPSLEDHHRGCINFAVVDKEIKREHIGKGTVLLSSLEMTKNICYRFKAVITMFTNAATSITLKSGYSPIVHLYTVRQAARMIIDPRENNNQTEIVFDGKNTSVVIATFKFKQNPEFIEPFNRFLLRSGSIQGVGLVISVTPIDEDSDARPDPVKGGRNRFRKKPPTGGVTGLVKHPVKNVDPVV